MIFIQKGGKKRHFNEKNPHILEVFQTTPNEAKITVVLSTDTQRPRFYEFETLKGMAEALKKISGIVVEVAPETAIEEVEKAEEVETLPEPKPVDHISEHIQKKEAKKTTKTAPAKKSIKDAV